jgi:hypothetical protein
VQEDVVGETLERVLATDTDAFSVEFVTAPAAVATVAEVYMAGERVTT